MCFTDCLYFADCEHEEPNFCGVAAPCRGFPFCDETCPDCGGCYWIYPTREHPTAVLPGPARIKVDDLTDEEIARLNEWNKKNSNRCKDHESK
jgi:hypothetical protein